MSDSSVNSSDRIIGQVKWFNTKAGYGFITVKTGEHSGKDIFVHYSAILVENSQYKYLVQGEYVEFCLVKSTNDKYEYHAVDVSGICKGTIMCETRKAAETANPTPKIRKYNTGTKSTEDKTSSRKETVPASGEDGFNKVEKKRKTGGPRRKTDASSDKQ